MHNRRLAGAALLPVAILAIWLGGGGARPVPPLPTNPRPSWLRQGLVGASLMEPLSFHIRRGGAPIDVVERWNASYSEPTARRFKEMGIDWVILTLHKAAGLEAESEDIARAKQFTEVLHRYGIRVAGYIGSTMDSETFYLEEPAAREWEQVNERGRPLLYGSQTFRRAACRNNPGYRDFIKKVLRVGIEDLKMDLFHFDQLMWWGQPNSCHCRHCAEQFRDYLRRTYVTPQQWKVRFGFARMDIQPPVFNLDEPPVHTKELADPLMQEWARFRAWSLAERYREYHEFIRSLNPEAALQGNPTMNPAVNVGFVYGVDLQQLMQHGELMWSEESNQARLTGDGALISHVRSFKIARKMKKSLIVTQGLPMDAERWVALRQPGPEELRLAEAIAYNDMNIGVVAGGFDFSEGFFSPARKRYVDFFREHARDLADTAPVGDVAVLRSFASVEFNPSEALLGAVLFEQTLTQHKIPFHIIFDRHLGELPTYKVLVLAGQDALSDEQVEQVRIFVRNGGGLVVTGHTSMLDEWRRRRDRFALADVIGLDAPLAESGLNQPVRRHFGKGRVVYIARIEPAVAPPPPQLSYYIRNSNFRLPKNSEDMAEAIRWAAGGPLSVQVDAPIWVTMELADQHGSGNRVLHLLNFKVDEPLKNIPVRLRAPAGAAFDEAVVYSADGDPAQTLKPNRLDGAVSFNVPQLKIYSMVVLRPTTRGKTAP